MQEEHRRFGRDRVDLLERRQPLFGELVLGEAADHPHPLRRRRDGHLPLQHRHRIGQRAHAVPAQLHVEVEPAADDVQVVVDQAGQYAPALEVDDLRVRFASGNISLLSPTAVNLPSLIATASPAGFQGSITSKAAIMEDQVRRGRLTAHWELPALTSLEAHG